MRVFRDQNLMNTWTYYVNTMCVNIVVLYLESKVLFEGGGGVV